MKERSASILLVTALGAMVTLGVLSRDGARTDGASVDAAASVENVDGGEMDGGGQ